jgi:hypothetical protein
MYALVVPTCAEPTVALDPATTSTIPCPFKLTSWVAALLDKNASSVTVPDCAAARVGSRNSDAAKTAQQRTLRGWTIGILPKRLLRYISRKNAKLAHVKKFSRSPRSRPARCIGIPSL